jgi:peptidoglycan/xylan/chitin deacetylase (PgdA/CDA1 family)
VAVAAAVSLVIGGAAPSSAAPAVASGSVPAGVHLAATAVAAVPAWLVGRDATRVPTKRKVVALTFDGGGNAKGVAKVLATLKANDIKATMFLTGNFARMFPKKSRAIVGAGHVLGNHTDTHPNALSISDAALTRQVRRAERSIVAATGVSPRPFFRFPYGSRAPRDIRTVNAAGYGAVSWTVDAAGWLGTSGGMSVAKVRSRVLKALRPGAIVLMHLGAHPRDRSTLDADALPGLITTMRARGYSFITLAQVKAG